MSPQFVRLTSQRQKSFIHFLPDLSPFLHTHRHTFAHTPEKTQVKKGRLKQQNQIQWRWPLQWPAGCPVGTVLKPKATVAKLFVSEMCREVKWLLRKNNQWKEFYFEEIKLLTDTMLTISKSLQCLFRKLQVLILKPCSPTPSHTQKCYKLLIWCMKKM